MHKVAAVGVLVAALAAPAGAAGQGLRVRLAELEPPADTRYWLPVVRLV